MDRDLIVEHRRPDGYVLTNDPRCLDLDVVHGFLTRSYWSPGVARETVARAAQNSLCFHLLHAGRQVGFARAVTDRATFAYLADVFLLEEHRGQGLGAWMVGHILALPELAGLRRWLLATRDAHGLYARFGFRPLADPERFLTIHDPRAGSTGGGAQP
jgi:GNAT superfamily N-acetyltransferase